MATKERLSNETLARVLVRNTEEFATKLQEHSNKVSEIMQRKISVDIAGLKQATQELNEAQTKASQEYLKLIREERSKLSSLLDGMPKWYFYVNTSVFAVLLILGFVLYLKIQKYEEKSRLLDKYESTYNGLEEYLRSDPKQLEAWNSYWKKKRTEK